MMRKSSLQRHLTDKTTAAALVLVLTTLLFPLRKIDRVRAQEPSPTPAASISQIDKTALHQALLDLSTPWTVMCVAAHPDDEDGTTLTVLRRKYGVHTVSLFSTYGEGGQNAVGPELYEQLGVIRADETRRAAAIQGSEPYFLGLKDFGFSKSADEAFRIWGHDEALRRMVLKIRQLRPDAIITNHDTVSGHGHHQATGRLVLEAFEAAADAKRFPEQLGSAGAWQVKRLFVRYRSSQANTDIKLVVIDPNEVDPLRGTSYGAQALQALQQHATQGPWPESVASWLRAQNNQTGKLNLVRYQLVKEAPDTQPASQNDSAIPFVDGLQLPADVTQRLIPPKVDGKDLFDPALNTETVVTSLIQWRKALSSQQQPNADPARFAAQNEKLNEALAIATGMKLTITAANPVLVAGSIGRIVVNLANEGSRIFTIRNLRFTAWQTAKLDAADHVLPDTETNVPVELAVPKDEPLTVPRDEHLYDELVNGKLLSAEAEVEVEGGARFTIRRELDLPVAPAIEIKAIKPNPYVLTPGTMNRPLNLQVELRNNTSELFRGVIKLTSPSFRIFEFGKEIVLSPQQMQTAALQVSATPNRRRRSNNSNSLTVSVGIGSNAAISQRQVPILQIDARVAPKRAVGYIPSFDNTLETSLAALGVEAQALSMEDVKSSDLTKFDTIIIDNRGYQAHPELIANNPRLLEYVANGGTLLVFYQRDGEWNPDQRRGRPQLAPYPIILGNDRVTEEDAVVTFRHRGHRLLNFPNRITRDDFKNWVQERGLYYPREWDPKYEMLFSMHDTGEKPLYSGLLVAKYGKGNYIYTSMVWYRQLRAGVSGGYRMFANLISY